MTSEVRKEDTKWASDKGTIVLHGVFDVQWVNTYVGPSFLRL